MELDYLREFVALAQTCQFQETADRLFISQSSLSKHIKAIEKEFGVELLSRSTRRVELSEFGRAFLPYAEQIAQIQREYTLTLLPTVQNHEKKVTMGVIPLVTFYRLNGVVNYFSQKFPDYSIEFVEHDAATLREMLRRGTCDLIVVCEDPEQPDDEFRSTQYTTDNLVAVLPETHVLAGRKALGIDDLAAYPLIQLGKLDLAKYLGPKMPPSSLVVIRTPMMIDMVMRGMGIGILTYHAFLHFKLPGTCCIPLDPPTEIRMNLLYPKQKRKNSMAVQSILEYVCAKK